MISVNYLNIYRTDLHQICRQRSEVSFSIPQGTLLWQQFFFGFIELYPQNWVHMTFGRQRHLTRSATAALDAGKQITDRLTVSNRQLGGYPDELRSGFALHLVHFLSYTIQLCLLVACFASFPLSRRLVKMA